MQQGLPLTAPAMEVARFTELPYLCCMSFKCLPSLHLPTILARHPAAHKVTAGGPRRLKVCQTQQIRCFEIECSCDLYQIQQSEIPLAAFDLPKMRSINRGIIR